MNSFAAKKLSNVVTFLNNNLLFACTELLIAYVTESFLKRLDFSFLGPLNLLRS